MNVLALVIYDVQRTDHVGDLEVRVFAERTERSSGLKSQEKFQPGVYCCAAQPTTPHDFGRRSG